MPLICPPRKPRDETSRKLSALAGAASLALRDGNSGDPACCAQVVQRSEPAMVWPWTRAGAGREPDVHLEAHPPIQGRQAEDPLALQWRRDIRRTRSGSGFGAVANQEDEGAGIAP